MTAQCLKKHSLNLGSELLNNAMQKAKSEANKLQHYRRYRKALGSPSRVYRHPADVLADANMNQNEKHEILQSWRSEAFLLQTAENEGFEGGELCLVDEIEICLNRTA